MMNDIVIGQDANLELHRMHVAAELLQVVATDAATTGNPWLGAACRKVSRYLTSHIERRRSKEAAC